MAIIRAVKRINFFRLFIFFVLTAYATLLMLSIFGVIFPFYKTWFSYGLIFISILLVPRFISFGIDTNLWAGSVLFLCGSFGVIRFYENISTLYSLAGYLFCFGLSSLIMFCFFRQIFHLKIFTFMLFSAIIIFVYESGAISLIAFIISLVSVFAFALFFAIKTILSNTRKVWNFQIKRMDIIHKKLMLTF